MSTIIDPLNKRISKLVDSFLDDADYYEKFKAIAVASGVESEDPGVVKVAMFAVKNLHITFKTLELEDLFVEWQLFTQLADQQPYSLLLAKYPERKPAVMKVAKKMLDGDDVSDESIIELFKGLEDEG